MLIQSVTPSLKSMTFPNEMGASMAADGLKAPVSVREVSATWLDE